MTDVASSPFQLTRVPPHALAPALAHTLRLAASSLAFAASLSFPALANETDAASADAVALAALSFDAADAAEVIVSARRREESAQDVPVALSVVDNQALANIGTFSVAQVQQLVPTLQVFSFNPRNTNVNIRGLGSNISTTNDGLDNGVGVYIDNVFYGRVGQSQFDLVDLQQIEVLRGPQGTLFGKNTTAGAINISTRAPSFEPEFDGELTLGNYGSHQARFSASGPLIADTLAARLSVADTHRDGFVRNVYNGKRANDSDNFSTRLQLLAQPGDALKIRLIGDYSKQTAHGVLQSIAGVTTTYADGTPIPNNFLDRIGRAGYAVASFDPFDRKVSADSPYQANMKSYGVSAQIDWETQNHALTSITAWRAWDWNPGNDLDHTSLPVLTAANQANRQRQFSQELRLASTGRNTVDYVVGAYYFWQTIRGYGLTGYGAAAADWNLPTVPAFVGNAALNGFESRTYSEPTTNSYALFGQATWNINEALSLTGGLRYTHEKKKGVFRSWHEGGQNLSLLPDAAAGAAQGIRDLFAPRGSYTARLSDDSVSGLLTLSYKPGEDVLVYGSYSRGSKSGGLNLTILPEDVNPQVDPETVDAFEIGLKSQWFDDAVTLNLATFHTKVSDYQTVVVSFVDNTSVFRTYVDNIPSVRSRGIEADIGWAVNERLSLSASAAYIDAIYKSYANAQQAPEYQNVSALQDLSGERLAGVPKFTWSASADYTQPLGDWRGQALSAYVHADYAHRSSYFSAITNSPSSKAGNFGVLNARLGLRAGDEGRWDLSVWARNLTNEKYFVTTGIANTGLASGLLGDPRTWGVTLRTKL